MGDLDIMPAKWDLQRFGRATSFNLELEFANGKVVHPVTMGEFGDKIEGSIEVVQGKIKYMILDQIENSEEIEMVINIEDDRADYDVAVEAADSRLPQDIKARYRNALDEVALEFVLEGTLVSRMKRNAFDRKGKAEDQRTFKLLPERVEEL